MDFYPIQLLYSLFQAKGHVLGGVFDYNNLYSTTPPPPPLQQHNKKWYSLDGKDKTNPNSKMEDLVVQQ